jgi:hypothetical protein
MYVDKYNKHIYNRVTHTHTHTNTSAWISFLRPAHPSNRLNTHLPKHLIHGPGRLFQLRLAVDQPALCEMQDLVFFFAPHSFFSGKFF